MVYLDLCLFFSNANKNILLKSVKSLENKKITVVYLQVQPIVWAWWSRYQVREYLVNA